jgi:hypothetical protein
MCEAVEVWKSMFLSGTPCPILSNGKLVVGKRAVLIMKRQPEVYIPDYTKNTEWYNTILNIGGEDTDEEDDIISVSAKFRSTQQ